MSQTIFITGGARSGKSRLAEERAERFGERLGYLATAQIFDDEMGHRVDRHRQRRGDRWTTTEEPYRLAAALQTMDGTFDAILVDCVTIWLSNLLLQQEETTRQQEALILAEVQHLAATLRSMSTPVILVSNEVGMGIVPEHRLGRIFRDLAGEANQILAAAADEVQAVISGIPLKLK